MKTLVLTGIKETRELIRNLLRVHFTKSAQVYGDHNDFVDLIINEGPFDLAILDIDDGKIEPLIITKQINELYGPLPTLFFGNDFSIKRKMSDFLLNNNSANAIINLPRDLNKFIQLTKSINTLADNKEYENSILESTKDRMLPMKIKNFYRIKQLDYDAYIEVLNGKYVKVLQRNVKITNAQVGKLVKSGHKFLYFPKEDKIQFLDKLLDNQMVILKKKGSNRKFFNDQINSLNIIHEYILTIGVSTKVTEATRLLIKNCDNTRMLYKSLTDIILNFPFKEKDVAERSIFLLYINLLLLEVLGWNSEISKEKMCMSSLFHDICLGNDELLKFRNIDEPAFEQLDAYLQDMFIKHPAESAKIVSCFSGFHESAYIISQHHEAPNGKGFPNKLNGLNMTTLACLFILADTFTHQLCQGEIDYKNINLIFYNLEDKFTMGHFKDAIIALKHCLSF